MNFKVEILVSFEFLGPGYQTSQQTTDEISTYHLHFQIKSKREGRKLLEPTSSEQSVQRSYTKDQATKIT